MNITIERLGHRGDGIAAGPIFVPLTLPGEVVEGTVEKGRIVAPRIVTPSSDRVRPPCRHFKTCGGCALQHASDSFVEQWKQDIVHTALAAQGLDAPVSLAATSPAKSRRRATFSGRRTKKGAQIGFHARASDTIVEIPDCQLLTDELLSSVDALKDLMAIGASRKAELSFQVTQSLVGLDIAVTGGKPLDDALRLSLPGVVINHKIARLTWDDETVATTEPPAQRFGSALVVPPPGAFLQATEPGQAALVNCVKQAIGDAGQIADLFAGCGTFALSLATQAEVLAVEDSAEMLAALDAGWRKAIGLKRITTQTRDLFRRPLMPDELRKLDAVVIDPPRAGAEAQVNELAKSEVPVIAAVSCNPVTFARDAKILTDAGYLIDWVQVVDQFRWSPHVEFVAKFRKP